MSPESSLYLQCDLFPEEQSGSPMHCSLTAFYLCHLCNLRIVFLFNLGNSAVILFAFTAIGKIRKSAQNGPFRTIFSQKAFLRVLCALCGELFLPFQQLEKSENQPKMDHSTPSSLITLHTKGECSLGYA